MTRVAYALLLPALLSLIVWCVVPLVGVGYLSLHETTIVRQRWVGMQNYLELLRDREWWGAVANSLAYAAMIVPAKMLPAVWMALVIGGMRRRGQNAMRFLLYAPALGAGIILSQVWLWIFHPGNGLANSILACFGIHGVRWFGTRILGLAVISLVMVSVDIGATVVVLSAVLLAVPRELREAARCDGAGLRQIRWYIDLPWLLPTVGALCLLSLIGAMTMWETIYVMSYGSGGTTANMMFNLWQTGFGKGQYGLASAKSLVMLAVVGVASVGVRRLRRG